MSKQIKTIEKTIQKVVSEEKLSNELDVVAKEILKQQEEKAIKNLTNPSAMALSTTKHEAGQGVDVVKKNPRQLFILYLTNQFVARAINIRADTLISKGYDVIGKDEKGVTACEDLIENSGGINLFWQLSVNTDIAGDGFNEKIYNKAKTAILRLKHVHPLTLSYKTDIETNKIIVDTHGEPIGYVQYYTGKDGIEETKDVSLDRISHLRFNTLGDEFTGISTIQSGYDTIIRLMNMEYAAAEAAIKTANPIIVGKCNTKSPHQIAMWGNILGKINGREQVFIPQDMELDMLSPGAQNFSDYSDYFLDAVVAATGVPKAMILGSSSSSGSNRAEMVVLSRHFYSLIRSNQRYIQDYFNTIFKEYAEIAGFEAPKLEFADVAEDAEVNAKSAMDLFAAGIVSQREARIMIGLEAGKIGDQQKGNVDSDLKKSDMEVWHPASQGKPSGSQAGVKDKQKTDSSSTVNPVTTQWMTQDSKNY